MGTFRALLWLRCLLDERKYWKPYTTSHLPTFPYFKKILLYFNCCCSKRKEGGTDHDIGWEFVHLKFSTYILTVSVRTVLFCMGMDTIMSKKILQLHYLKTAFNLPALSPYYTRTKISLQLTYDYTKRTYHWPYLRWHYSRSETSERSHRLPWQRHW